MSFTDLHELVTFHFTFQRWIVTEAIHLLSTLHRPHIDPTSTLHRPYQNNQNEERKKKTNQNEELEEGKQ